MPDLATLHVDPRRRDFPHVGIPVRAKDGDEWVAADISALTRDSLIEWLRSRPNHAINTVLVMLCHEQVRT